MTFQKGNKVRLGMKNSNKQKEAVRAYMKSRSISKETREKMSLATKKWINVNGHPLLGKKIPYKSRPLMKSRLSGENNPFYGKRHSPESIKKMSQNSIGKTAKERNGNWKGGATRKHYGNNKTERMRFRVEIQKKVLERDNYTCQICGVRGVDLQVDHIQSWAEYVELRFNIDNCRTLCAKCHYQITFGKPMPPTVRAWGHNLLKGGTEQ